MNFNPSEKRGEDSINSLLEITKPKKEKEKNPIIKELEDMGVFD